MIKAKLENGQNGRVYFVFGFSDHEIEQLKRGELLGFQMEQFGFAGPPHVVVMMHNHTYEGVKADIAKIEIIETGLVFPKSRGAMS